MIAQRIYYSTNERIAYGNFHDPASAFDEVPFFDRLKLTEQNRADFIFLQIQSQSADLAGKFQKFAGHDFFQTVNFCNAVTDLNNCADLHDGHTRLEILDLLTNNIADLASLN